MCLYTPWVYSCFDRSQTTSDERDMRVIKGAHGWKLGLLGGWSNRCEDYPNCEKTASFAWERREEIPHRCKICLEKRRAELAELARGSDSSSGKGVEMDSGEDSGKETVRDLVRGSPRVAKSPQRK